MALVILIISFPVLGQFRQGDIVASVLMSLLLISGVLAVSRRPSTMTVAILLVIPAFAGQWVDHYQPGAVPAWMISGAELVFVAFVVVQLLRFIVRAPRVNAEVLCAGIANFLLLALVWTNAYLILSWSKPGAFAVTRATDSARVLDHFEALYLSFVTLTCLGCNDITPVIRSARMLIMTESTVGVLYLAVLIARLVALYSQEKSGGRAP